MIKLELLKQIWNNRNIILKAFYNKVFRGYDKINVDRLEMCDDCLQCSINKNNPNYNPGKYTNLPYEHCTMCGCSIYLKIFSEWDKYPNPQYNPCPKKKWLK